MKYLREEYERSGVLSWYSFSDLNEATKYADPTTGNVKIRHYQSRDKWLWVAQNAGELWIRGEPAGDQVNIRVALRVDGEDEPEPIYDGAGLIEWNAVNEGRFPDLIAQIKAKGKKPAPKKPAAPKKPTPEPEGDADAEGDEDEGEDEETTITGADAIETFTLPRNAVKTYLTNDPTPEGRIRDYLIRGFVFHAFRQMRFEKLINPGFDISGIEREIDAKVSEICEKHGFVDKYSDDSTPRGLVKRVFEDMLVNNNILLTGEPGVGKTCFILDILPELLGNPEGLIAIDPKKSMSYADLVGGIKLKGGNTQFGEGGFTEAILRANLGEASPIVYLSEINLYPEGVLKSANNFLSHRTVNFHERGAKMQLRANPGAEIWVFADMNPLGEALARDKSGSVRDRFTEVKVSFFKVNEFEFILRKTVYLTVMGQRIEAQQDLTHFVAKFVIGMRSLILSDMNSTLCGDEINLPSMRLGKTLVRAFLTSPASTLKDILNAYIYPFLFERVIGEPELISSASDEVIAALKKVVPGGETRETSEIINASLQSLFEGAGKSYYKL